jgi:endoglucanase
MKRSLTIIAAIGMTLLQGIEAQDTGRLSVNEKEYLDSKNLSVLAFHNIYPVGMQGGIEIIHHNLRTATNGTLAITRKQETELIPGVNASHQPIPPINNPERRIEGDHIVLPFKYDDVGLEYEIVVSPTEQYGFEIHVNFLKPVDQSRIEKAVFTMEFYPELFAGQSFISDNGFGVFPFVFNGTLEHGTPVPYATGSEFVFAPEDERIRMKIASRSGEMQLTDSRSGSQRYWLTLNCEADLSKTEGAVSLVFTPHIIENWVKPPMIAYSQLGYHPDQEKVAILELDPAVNEPGKMSLLRLNVQGEYMKVLELTPVLWGKFLRYQYAEADFSGIKEPGIYRLSYENEMTGPFKISRDIYGKGPWELTLDLFYPVQMCHMKVIDRDRVWHGVCHLDDALQVPSPKPFFDGYRQGEQSESDFNAHTTIPGLTRGGWHDAADDDIHYVSTGRAAYDLALAFEEFDLDRDQTRVDFTKREVQTYTPDGIPDAIQQVIHGAQWLVAHYRVSDHAFPGVISSNWDTYVKAADWGLHTDNMFYHPEYPADSANGTFSGRLDDRYVFTNRDTRRDYFAAAILSAISRVIAPYDAILADECLNTSLKIWERESNREPVFFRNVGTPGNLTGQRVNAAVELYLTTGDHQYLNYLETNRKEVFLEIKETGWTVSRVLGHVEEPSFSEQFKEALRGYRDGLETVYAKNPFGVEYDQQVWGIGWNILWEAEKHYYLVKHHPDIFDRQYIIDALAFVLGRHPGNNISFVSGLGTHRPIPTFAVNKMDYGYTPGGVFSGTSLVLPDYPELRDDHPFLWQQSEIMIWGATPYLFSVLAADKLLNP